MYVREECESVCEVLHVYTHKFYSPLFEKTLHDGTCFVHEPKCICPKYQLWEKAVMVLQ